MLKQPGALARVSSGFLPLLFSLGMTTIAGCMFDCRIDFPAYEKCQSGDIKPQQQNDHRAQRAISFAVAVEKMEIDAKAGGGKQPEQDSSDRTRSNPIPVFFLHIGAKIVDQSEGCGDKE